MKKLDFKGLVCPQPVIKTKEYLENNPETLDISIVVDNNAASENVSRFLSNQGFSVKIKKVSKGFELSGVRENNPGISRNFEEKQENNENKHDILIMFSGLSMGSGNIELGKKLMVNFIKTLPEMGSSLWRVVFVNESVKFTAENSELIETFEILEKQGTSILVCGTCLEYFGIMDKKKVGETTNMLDIVTSLEVSNKVINY